jgi:hypothetical protein
MQIQSPRSAGGFAIEALRARSNFDSSENSAISICRAKERSFETPWPTAYAVLARVLTFAFVAGLWKLIPRAFSVDLEVPITSQLHV